MVIGAPIIITEEFLNRFKIDIVIHGMTSFKKNGVDPYQVPKQLGKFKQIDSGNHMSSTTIVQRIINNARQYKLRNLNKEKKELEILRLQDSDTNNNHLAPNKTKN